MQDVTKMFKTRLHNGIIYSELTQKGFELNQNLVDKYLTFIPLLIQNRYMAQCPKILWNSNIRRIPNGKKVNDVIGHLDMGASIRLETNLHAELLIMAKNETEDDNGLYTTLAILTVSHNDESFIEFVPVSISYDPTGALPTSITNSIGTIFYWEDKYKSSKKKMEDNRIIAAIRKVTDEHITIICDMLDAKPDSSYPSYNKVEMKFITSHIPVGGYMSTTIKEYQNTIHVHELYTIPDELIDGSDKTTWPEIDLSQNENKFILKYCDDKDFLTNTPVDIYSLVTQNRLGNKFRMMTKKENGKEYMLNIYFDTSMENKIRFYISTNIGSVYSVGSVLLLDCDKYVIGTSLSSVNYSMLFMNQHQIPKNEEEIIEVSAFHDYDATDICKIFTYILDVLLVMRDRPQRMKVLKCTEKKEKEIVNRKKNAKPSKKEQDFVVTRILKSAKEAKALIGERAEFGVRRESEYTIEEWDRVAHTRQLKSGRIVYVKEAICHRHKNLTTKPIHVKL